MTRNSSTRRPNWEPSTETGVANPRLIEFLYSRRLIVTVLVLVGVIIALKIYDAHVLPERDATHYELRHRSSGTRASITIADDGAVEFRPPVPSTLDLGSIEDGDPSPLLSLGTDRIHGTLRLGVKDCRPISDLAMTELIAALLPEVTDFSWACDHAVGSASSDETILVERKRIRYRPDG